MPKEPERKYPLGLIFQALQEGLWLHALSILGPPGFRSWGAEALVFTGRSQASPFPQHLGLAYCGARPGLGLALCN